MDCHVEAAVEYQGRVVNLNVVGFRRICEVKLVEI